VSRPPPPRALPPQDHAAIDRAERVSHRLTWAVGAAAGLIALAVACGLASGFVLRLLVALLPPG
jgi:hypothetical protein